MKLALPLSLIVAAATSLACSSDEGNEPRPTGGTGGTGTGTAGTSTGGTGTGGTGTGGTGTGGGGAGGAPAMNFTYGTAYTITAEGNVTDSGNTGVNGGAFLTQSENMTVVATTSHRDGGLCFSGTTAVVPNPDSYGTYWGAELGLNLNLVPADGAAPPADAGADAGAVELEPAPWPYGNVIGFSYTLVGNDQAAVDKGVPATRIRFKALPQGSDPMNDNYCSDRAATADGKVENVLFSDITFECWTPGALGLAGAEINRVDLGPPRLPVTAPNPRALQNISWQIASDVAATTPAPIAFDFCITDLKPIVGQ